MNVLTSSSSASVDKRDAPLVHGTTDIGLDLLRTFVTVVNVGGFTRAAERVNRTQSTISLQIKRLEDLLGKQLLVRGPREVGLTPDGEILLGYAREMLRLNDTAVSRLTEPDLTGVVRLGTPEDFATAHLSDVLAAFARSHPSVALAVQCDLTLRLLDRFGNGEFDLVLVKREPQGAAGGDKVWREPLVWVAGDGFDVEVGLPLPLVLSPHPCVYRKRAIDGLKQVGRDWRIVYTSPSLAGTQAAVRAGLGAAVLPRDMVPDDFRVLDDSFDLPHLDDTEIALYRAQGGISLAAERLADYMIRSLERRSLDGRSR